MHLIVDARHYDSGIGTYTLAVLRAVQEIVPAGSWSAIVRTREQQGQIEMDLAQPLPVWKMIDAGMYTVAEQIRLARLPAATVFLACHYPVSLLYRGRLIVTVHDLAHFELPKLYPASCKRWLAWQVLRRALKRAEIVLTVSAVTSERLASLFGKAVSDKIRIVGNALAGSFVRAENESTEYPQELLQAGCGRFVLFVGNLKPHKHPELVVEAVRVLRQESGFSDLGLVMAGRADFSGSRLAGLPLDESWIKWYQNLSRAELAALYRQAAVLCLPSEYEGFGLPPLEALAAGTPLVLSDLPVFREIYGEAAVYLKALTPDALADSLGQVLVTEQGGLARSQAAALCLERYGQAAFTARLAQALASCSIQTTGSGSQPA